MAQSKAERDTAIKKIKNKICVDFDVYPDEVILRSDHKIVVDRRRRFPGAVPMVVGEWR
ncbi:hypothetical protein [Nonomuraea turcica]|uniref:hypothetical protein n=1 Tax=Nonomuraea sp. G32 TaxID=3067274 RepID=UPI00273AB6BA|nr:hypothetical protein [Nonomuraea sp. G32]MDP4507007.1 hypothetical protein [Nonomuraea sp. G32]